MRRPSRFDVAFLAVVAVMAAHQAEHLSQVAEKEVLANSCPVDCRGALGFVFDVETVHFAYNLGILAALVGLSVAGGLHRRSWRLRHPGAWTTFVFGALALQSYHMVEHVAKLAQWFGNGHQSPTPGVLGQFVAPPFQGQVSLIELHFLLNSVVFASVLVGYFGFGLHRRAWPWTNRLPALAVIVLLAAPLPVVWALRTPTTVLAAGVHEGPLVIDTRQKVVGEPGAVVRGGIVITATGVALRDVTVEGGEHGIEIVGARDVQIERVTVRDAELDGINARRSTVLVRDCRISGLRSPYAQGIDVSFAFDLRMSRIQGCHVTGGQEGIVSHFAKVDVRDNVVSGTTQRGITLTEMSMGTAIGNEVSDGLGVGIFCGDYSHCRIERNVVSGIRPDVRSGDKTRRGYGIQSHYYSLVRHSGNRLDGVPRHFGAYIGATIERS
jgi:hypothetical protein